MKAILTSLYAVVCIVFIGISHYYWTEKTTASQNVEGIDQEKTKTADQTEEFDKLISYTKNWPSEGAERFILALKENKPFKLVIAGSTALGGESGWAQQTKTRLLDTYGKDRLTVEVREYDMTSTQFIEEEKPQELASLKGDMILFEPFILKNNGVLELDDTLADLTAIIDAVKQEQPETVFLLQPSYPIYQAAIYPNQVDGLKEYAEENEIPYLDHWKAWPDFNMEEITTYLAEDQSQPSNQGHEVWSKYICDYLISQ